MALVSVKSLFKSYGDTSVLKGIDLDVQAGESVAIIGRSGSGKSTFLRCLNQLEAQNEGEILIDNMPLEHHVAAGSLSETVGMVFQNFNLFPHKTVGENVMLAPMLVKKVAAHQAREKACEVLEKVGMIDKFDEYPAQLSGGQQQRVAIARALAMNPKVLLCDEATSALDPELVGEVLKVLESLACDGMTLILVTHEMGFARDVSDRVVFMHEGKIHEQGRPCDVFASPSTPELRNFLASVL